MKTRRELEEAWAGLGLRYGGPSIVLARAWATMVFAILLDIRELLLQLNTQTSLVEFKDTLPHDAPR